jgi:predicted HicB family RNase H-like nuclease
VSDHDLEAVFVEVSDEQHARWRAAAAREGLPLATWIATVLDWRAAVDEQEDEHG